MTAFSDAVADFHAAIHIVEAALSTSSYDFVRDRDRVAARFEATWQALKAAAKPNATRDDVRAMLAENANRYRDCSRSILEMRDPKAAAKRKMAARTMRRTANIELFVVEEVAAYWKRDTERRSRR